jgi:hypothetical protein
MVFYGHAYLVAQIIIAHSGSNAQFFIQLSYCFLQLIRGLCVQTAD